MKQRVWAVVLMVVMLTGILGGCGNKGPQTKEYGQKPPIEPLSWGMSENEVLQALKLTEDDVTLSTREDVSNMSLQEDRELSGVSGKVSLQFLEREALDVGLFSVTLSPAEQDIEVLSKKLDETLGFQGEKKDNAVIWTTGEDKISSLAEEAWKDALKDLVDQDGALEEKDAYTQVILSSVTKSGNSKSQVVFLGKAAAYSAALQRQAE